MSTNFNVNFNFLPYRLLFNVKKFKINLQTLNTVLVSLRLNRIKTLNKNLSHTYLTCSGLRKLFLCTVSNRIYKYSYSTYLNDYLILFNRTGQGLYTNNLTIYHYPQITLKLKYWPTSGLVYKANAINYLRIGPVNLNTIKLNRSFAILSILNLLNYSAI